MNKNTSAARAAGLCDNKTKNKIFSGVECVTSHKLTGRAPWKPERSPRKHCIQMDHSRRWRKIKNQNPAVLAD